MSSTRTLRFRNGMVVTGAFAAVAVASVVPQAQAGVAPARVAASCTSVVTGFLAGAQTVATGEKLCLRGATVDGAITVGVGGSLASRHSTVNGAITLQAGSKNFKFCGSTTVGGEISAAGGVGFAKIGDNKNCAGNKVDGAITVAGYVDRVILARTKTTGGVVFDNNVDTSGKAATVSGNKVGGSLSCEANVPAPTNAGRLNDVYGAKTGQCAGDDF
jgi:5'-nucleotidase